MPGPGEANPHQRGSATARCQSDGPGGPDVADGGNCRRIAVLADVAGVLAICAIGLVRKIGHMANRFRVSYLCRLAVSLARSLAMNESVKTRLSSNRIWAWWEIALNPAHAHFALSLCLAEGD